MMKMKKVLIMGLGLHGGGVGAANYFISKGASVVITDLKKEEELRESIEKLKGSRRVYFVLGRHDFKDFKNVDLIIKNPAVAPNSPYIEYALKHGVKVDTDIGIFLDRTADITSNNIGVTGTKGKSTTAYLIYKIIKQKYPDTLICGNIAVSVFDILDRVKQDSYIILELSSFQLGGIDHKGYSPRIGVFTNFMEDHLNYYNSMEDYFNDKAVLYRFQKKNDVLVLNRDDRSYNLVEKKAGVKVLTFGLKSDFSGEGVFVSEGRIFFKDANKTEYIMDTGSIRLPGKHNLYNILAAAATTYNEGFSADEIRDEVFSFHGLEHRLEYVGCKENILFYNDSAATTPEASIKGIESFDGPLTLIAGGYDKDLTLSRFVEAINRRVNNLILLDGNGTRRLIKEGIGEGFKVFNNLRDAVYHAYRVSKPSSKILLSPGFASFGMFFNEFHRGNEFKSIVREIMNRGVSDEKRKKLF